MYRQVNVGTEDSYLQLIVWRDNPNEDLRYYRLKKSHPLASSAIKDFYVGDVMTGSNSLKEAVKIKDDLKTLLQSAGFNLRKWCANHERLLSSIPSKYREVKLSVDDSKDEGVKTLGLTWNPKLDHFRITTIWNEPTEVTKRTVLSDTSRLFDPLGFVNPAITLAKIFLQELWSLKLDWDEAIPMGLHTRWLQFRQELADLNRIRIPRYLETKNATVSLHAFSDASERAYGVVIYLRSVNNHGDIKGPEFLSQPEIRWPCEVIKEPKDLPEQKTIRTVLTTSAVTDHFIDRIDHRNSFTHLKRIIATVLRAIQCFKETGHMQVKEFKADIKQLRRERPIDSKSKLTKLIPFLDNNSIIRVGGRLQNASILYTVKHPAILPTSHPFTKLLLVALRATARQQFWILRDEGLASAVVHECVQCSRLNPQTFKQLMGTLPDAWV
ncbi:unnamed protein product [Hermetia illucens]|uniref:Uncharacterized protein n=1 Tax=Hermetia illucens TaxID=343691 RepID=A0A7R8V6Q1_HERIL|nr:unnamed protein product [Hermetia illucens]